MTPASGKKLGVIEQMRLAKRMIDNIDQVELREFYEGRQWVAIFEGVAYPMRRSTWQTLSDEKRRR